MVWTEIYLNTVFWLTSMVHPWWGWSSLTASMVSGNSEKVFQQGSGTMTTTVNKQSNKHQTAKKQKWQLINKNIHCFVDLRTEPFPFSSGWKLSIACFQDMKKKNKYSGRLDKVTYSAFIFLFPSSTLWNCILVAQSQWSPLSGIDYQIHRWW